MEKLQEICENLEEFIELFIKILHEETAIIPGSIGSGVGGVICYLNWYNEHRNDWPERVRISEEEYDKIIHWISIGLKIPEKILKDVNYETLSYYNLNSYDSLFIAELYIFHSYKRYENTDRTRFMIEQYTKPH